MSQALVLGIETSCDETAIGIVRGRKLLANERETINKYIALKSGVTL